MYFVRDGNIHINLPSHELMLQTVRILNQGSSPLDAEIRFRKSKLSDLLKGLQGRSVALQEDLNLLVRMWQSNPNYLDYVVALHSGSGRVLTLYPLQETIDKASQFVSDYLSTAYATFESNAFVVGAMVDAMGVPVAQAAYLGSFVPDVTAGDINAVKVLGLSPEEISACKTAELLILNPSEYRDAYLSIRRATNSIESVMFASTQLDVDFLITLIESGVSFDRFMNVVRQGGSIRDLGMITKFDIDQSLFEMFKSYGGLGLSSNRTLALAA